MGELFIIVKRYKWRVDVLFRVETACRDGGWVLSDPAVRGPAVPGGRGRGPAEKGPTPAAPSTSSRLFAPQYRRTTQTRVKHPDH